MDVTGIFELFIKELESNRELQGYYRILDNPRRLLFRHAYLEQRLRYVHNHRANRRKKIWDVGCGYGTTAIFAALNGHRVKGVRWNSITTISGPGSTTGAGTVTCPGCRSSMKTYSTGRWKSIR